MSEITYNDIKNLNPCYDPIKYIGKNWKGTLQDILRMSEVPPEDRLWVTCHEEFIDKELLFKFAENCCWQIVNYLPDNEQLEYCNLLCIIRLSRETNDQNIRHTARYTARHTARHTAWYSAMGAAKDAVRDTARDTVWYTAWDVIRGVAWNAAWDATMDAAKDEFCLMLADMIDGTFKDFYLIDRLTKGH